MTLDKRCLSPGCHGHACFGFGSLLKGVMRWACNAHRHLLNPLASNAAVYAENPFKLDDSQGESSKAKQGVLL